MKVIPFEINFSYLCDPDLSHFERNIRVISDIQLISCFLTNNVYTVDIINDTYRYCDELPYTTIFVLTGYIIVEKLKDGSIQSVAIEKNKIKTERKQREQKQKKLQLFDKKTIIEI